MTDRILRLKEVMATVGLAKSTVWKMVALEQFPRPVRLSANAVGWRQSAVQKWIETRDAA